MALINPKTGSSRFNVIIRREAVVSLAGEEPEILSESEQFSLKLVSDVVTNEEISSKNLEEVPDEEIGADGIWTEAAAAKLNSLSKEELIAMILKQGVETDIVEEAPEETVEEALVEEAEEKPKTKRKRKAPAKKKEVEPEPEVEVEEIHTDAEDVSEEEIEDIEF